MTATKLATTDTIAKTLARAAEHTDLLTLASALRAYQANTRTARAHTKTRGEIRGGGRKPWKQKGTGRARAGSTRSPLWRGGGTIFGPSRERNFEMRLPATQRQRALSIALGMKVDALWSVGSWPTEAKTKGFAGALPKELLGKRVLIVLAESQTNVQHAVRNIAGVNAKSAGDVNALDITQADALVSDEAGYKALATRLKAKETPVAETKPTVKKSTKKAA